MITSNRTRELHDALKRRCLYHWIDFPELEREVEIIRLRAPGVSDRLARSVAITVARLRELDLLKQPGRRRGDRLGRGARGARRGDGRRRGRRARRSAGRSRRARTWSSPRARSPTAVADELLVMTRFGRELRDAGLRVGPGRTAEFCRAAALLEPGDLYWAGRATLVSRPQEIPVYDAVFAAFFRIAPRVAHAATRCA